MEDPNSHLRTGDVVIGSADPSRSVYSATGGKLTAETSRVHGDAALLVTQREDMIKTSTRLGGTLVPTPGAAPAKKGAKGRKAPAYATEPTPRPEFVPAPPVRLQTIQFENEFGRMKAKVEQLIEHDLAFMLVFSDDDAVLFEPKVGEQLTFHTPSRETYDVYYPGVTFDSPDSSKRFMILFKLPPDNE